MEKIAIDMGIKIEVGSKMVIRNKMIIIKTRLSFTFYWRTAILINAIQGWKLCL